MIKTNNLTKRFGTLTAVDSLNLDIAAGTFYGFLGPNGAGKTTTIKMMVGLLWPSRGEVWVGGYNLLEDPLAAKKITGYIPDRPHIYEKLTGREFLAFIAELYQLPKEVYTRRTEEFLEMFELTGWGDELIEGYSHGMRQKLVVASALMHEPKVIIVDEPMVGLDPKGARLVKQIFRSLCQKGVTIFMSTHSLEVAQEMCDVIGIIQEGKLIAQGTMEELRRQANTQESRLESIFLSLTGAEEVQAILPFLRQ